ncbi:hypothetical protein [Bartonella henselae]
MESATALLKSLGWLTEKIDENGHMASYQLAVVKYRFFITMKLLKIVRNSIAPF